MNNPRNMLGEHSLMDIKGKIKIVQQTAYKAIYISGEIQKGENAYICSTSINQDFVIQLNDSAQVLQEIFYCGPEKKETPYYHQYDSVKNTVIIEQRWLGKTWSKNIYKYNSKGQLVEEWTYQTFKEMENTNKLVFKYDEKGNNIEIEGISVKDKTSYKTLFKYDIKGNLVSQEFYNAQGGLWNKETFKVDAKGNTIENYYYIGSDNTIDHSFIFKYDLNNNVVSKEYYNPSKLVTKYTYTYEYDNKKNWIRRIDFENGKATLIVERTIKYF